MIIPKKICDTEKLADANKNADIMLRLIDKEKKKFQDKSAKRIVIGGVRQGAMLALAVLVKYNSDEIHLGGVFSLSGMSPAPHLI